MRILLITFCLLLTLTSSAFSQINFKNEFDYLYRNEPSSHSSYRDLSLRRSLSKNSADFMLLSYMMDALITMYKATNDTKYLREATLLIDNVISTSKVSENIRPNNYKYKDGYKSWTSPRTGFQESILYEGYLFRVVCDLLHFLNEKGWRELSVSNNNWYNATLGFVEVHVWQKWISRSVSIYNNPYKLLLYSRTHMASHWASIALILERISSNNRIKSEARSLYNQFDVLLKRNLKDNPIHPNTYKWNSTWDDVRSTNAIGSKKSIIQDVSHGNQVVSYIMLSRRLNNKNWMDSHVQKLKNTLKYVVFNTNGASFFDNLDRSSVGNKGSGRFQSDGWVRLGRGDKEINSLYKQYVYKEFVRQKNKDYHRLQLYAHIYYNETVF